MTATKAHAEIKWMNLRWSFDRLADGSCHAWAWTYDPAWTRQDVQTMADVSAPTKREATIALHRALTAQIRNADDDTVIANSDGWKLSQAGATDTY